MSISIIIPTYNRLFRLLEAVDSCLNQTLKPHEIIIGDDSTNDETLQGLRTYIEQHSIIKYHQNRPSLGQFRNVNKLIQLATGDKILLLHDDDLILPDCLETLNSCFDQNPEISAAYGLQYIMDDSGNTLEDYSAHHNEVMLRIPEYEGIGLTSLEAGLTQQFPNNAYLVLANKAKEIKYRNVGAACDYDFGLRLGKENLDFYFVNKYTSKYRLSADAITLSVNNDAAMVAFREAINTKVPEKSQKLKDYWLKRNSQVAFRSSWDNRNYIFAFKIFFSKYYNRRSLIKRVLNGKFAKN